MSEPGLTYMFYTATLRKKRSTQLLREYWSFLTKLMTCQNLQNKLLNIIVLFIWYLLESLKKNVTGQIWRALSHFGEYLFQSNRHFGECLKKMVSHTVKDRSSSIMTMMSCTLTKLCPLKIGKMSKIFISQ